MLRGAVIKGVLGFLALLPLPVCHFLGAALGWMLVLFPNNARRIAQINIALCFPEQSAKEQSRLLRRSLVEAGKTVMEFGPLWFWSVRRMDRLVREVRGLEVLDRAYAAGRGVLVAGPHLGAWEMGGFFCARRYPMHTLYRPPRLQELEALVRQARARGGATLVATDARGIRGLFQALRNQRLLGILPDQEPKFGTGVFAPFFGVPALTMVLIGRLARRSGAPVVFGFAERLPWGRGYRMHFLPAPEGIDADDAERSVTALNQGVEALVRIAPHQYQWTYKRFRTRPEGQPKVY